MAYTYHQVVAALQNKIAMILCFALPTVYVQWVSDILECRSLEQKRNH